MFWTKPSGGRGFYWNCLYVLDHSQLGVKTIKYFRLLKFGFELNDPAKKKYEKDKTKCKQMNERIQ